MYSFKTVALVLLISYSFDRSQAYFFQKCTSFSSTSSNKTASTSNGPVKGECYQVPVSYSNSSTVSYDLFTWLAIPFAQPPTGSNRFMSPKPVQSWTGVRDALLWPKACVQDQPVEQSEDCLYLNIFARDTTYLNKDRALRPVMIWIHGGAWVNGQSADNLYEPSTLVASSDVIVVSFNYRLGALGFLSLEGTEATGNAGFLDQHMAIKWVYENIKYFGGDNTKITLFGESAGSFSIGFHLFYSESWPYFRNAILQSGSPTGLIYFDSKTTASKTALSLLQELSCNGTTNIERLSCAQQINETNILSAGRTKSFNFVIDNVVFNKSISELANENKFKKCNILAGFDSDEWGFLLPILLGQGQFWNSQAVVNFNYTEFYNNLINVLGVSKSAIQEVYSTYFSQEVLNNLQAQSSLFYFQSFVRIGGDLGFICPTFDIAELWTQQNNLKAYVYEYKYRSEYFANANGTIYGVGHGSEIPIVFGEALSNKEPPLLDTIDFLPPGTKPVSVYSQETKRFTEKVMEYWTNFAKYDDPNSLRPSTDREYWQPFADSSVDLDSLTAQGKLAIGRYLLMENTAIRTVTGFDSFKCDFWNYTSDGESVPTTTVAMSSTTTVQTTGAANRNTINILFLICLCFITLMK